MVYIKPSNITLIIYLTKDQYMAYRAETNDQFEDFLWDQYGTLVTVVHSIAPETTLARILLTIEFQTLTLYKRKTNLKRTNNNETPGKNPIFF